MLLKCGSVLFASICADVDGVYEMRRFSKHLIRPSIFVHLFVAIRMHCFFGDKTMKKLVALSLSSLVVFLTACQKPVQTVDWYREHDKDRIAMIEKCNANPGELENTPNCINAKKASTLLEDIQRNANDLHNRVTKPAN